MRSFVLLICLFFSLPAFAALKTGDAAPNLLGKDGKGNDVLAEQFKGKVVVVTFWATWCGYCLKELPALNHIQNSVGTDFIQVIAVNQEEEIRTAQSVLRQMKDRKFLTTYDRKGKISENYGVSGLPNLWIIAPDGTIAAHHIGYGEESLSIIAKDILRILEKYNPDLLKQSVNQAN
jgi:thiol-disulfide isomerase/thioredoxin